MSDEENKRVARRWMEDVLNRRDLAAADEVLAVDVVDHFHPGPPRVFLPVLQSAFPDFHFTTEDLFAGEDEKVVVRFTFHGTHQGEFNRIHPTGKAVTFGGIAIMRFEDGKIAEFWESADNLGMLRQLGMALAPLQP